MHVVVVSWIRMFTLDVSKVLCNFSINNMARWPSG